MRAQVLLFGLGCHVAQIFTVPFVRKTSAFGVLAAHEASFTGANSLWFAKMASNSRSEATSRSFAGLVQDEPKLLQLALLGFQRQIVRASQSFHVLLPNALLRVRRSDRLVPATESRHVILQSESVGCHRTYFFLCESCPVYGADKGKLKYIQCTARSYSFL